MASMKKFTICFAFVYYSILFKCWLFIQYKPLNSLSFASKICLFKICSSGWSLGGKHLHRLLIVIRLGKESERLFISGSIASGKTPFTCREPRVRRSVIIEFPGIKLDDLPLFSLTIINRYTRQRNPNHCNEFRLPCARNGPSTSIL